MNTTSPTLLEKLRSPDRPDAWERFVRLYTPLLVAWAARQGLRGADAEDLAQEVLVKLLRLMPDYRRGSGQSFRDWLFTVTRNQAVDHRHRRATRPLPAADGLSGADGATDPDAVAEIDEREYRLGLLRGALEVVRTDFDPETVVAFTQTVLEEKPARDVAVELGLTPGAVYMARSRVLARLREHLDGLLD